MKKYYCTHCGKYLDKISIELSVYFLAERNTGNEWENVNNSQIINSEKVCEECFKEFTKIINKFKKDK